MVASAVIPVSHQQVVNERPRQHAVVLAEMPLIEEHNRRARVIDEWITPCNEHAHLEPQALNLCENVQQEPLVIQNLLSGGKGLQFGREAIRRKIHVLRDLVAVRRIRFHERFNSTLAIVQGRKR
jgi:hypothetical protein